MGKHRHVIQTVAIAAALSSCSEGSTGPEAPSCLPNTTSVEATVSVAGSVTFNWSPSCPVALLLVEGDDGDTWWVSTPESDWESPEIANKIVPPVIYGQMPASATDYYGPDPLLAGGTYELILWRAVPEGVASDCEGGFAGMCLLTIKTFVR